MSDEREEADKPLFPSEAEVNAGRSLTMGERVVSQIFGQIFGKSHTPCAGCRKR